MNPVGFGRGLGHPLVVSGCVRVLPLRSGSTHQVSRNTKNDKGESSEASISRKELFFPASASRVRRAFMRVRLALPTPSEVQIGIRFIESGSAT